MNQTLKPLIQSLFDQYDIPTRSQSLRIENGSAEINISAFSDPSGSYENTALNPLPSIAIFANMESVIIDQSC